MTLKRKFLIGILIAATVNVLSNTAVIKKGSMQNSGYNNGGHSNTASSDFINIYSSSYNNNYSNNYGNNYSNNYSYNFENGFNSNNTKKHVIGFAIANMTSPYLSALAEYSKAEAEKQGMEIIFADAEGDIQKQANQISDFIKQRVDAIILIPVDSESLVSSARMIKEANIPLINLNNRLDNIMSDLIDTFVGVNSTEQGEAAGDLMVEALGEKGGNILIIESMKNSDNVFSGTADFEDRVLQGGNIKIIGIRSASGDRKKAEEITEEFLGKMPQIDGIYVQDDDMVIGCIEAAKKANMAASIKFIGVGGSKEAYDYIKKGELYGIAAQSPQWEGVQAMKCAADILNNKKVKMWYRDSISKVTKENVDSFIDQW